MGSVYQLNVGLDRHMPHCGYCGFFLQDRERRAIAHTPSGPRYFCRAPDNGTGTPDSCFLRWKRRHP
jgi:hypothetical protein